VMAAPTGVLNVDIEVATTDDSVFQIGSITKVCNTTLVMQLVDEGLINLDAPIVEALPELQLSNQQVAGRVTMRHLLTHTLRSGLRWPPPISTVPRHTSIRPLVGRRSGVSAVRAGAGQRARRRAPRRGSRRRRGPRRRP